MALQAGGKIVTAGAAVTLARHKADGSLDTTFGAGGKVSTTFGAGARSATDVAIQGDDKIVVVGSTRARAASTSAWQSRFNRTGRSSSRAA